MWFIFFIILLIWLYGLTWFSTNSEYEDSDLRSKPIQYGRKSMTLNGEEVKSKGEKRIADYFKSKNIKYVYEPGLREFYADPDFYLPDYDVYVEYWGLLNARDAWVAQKYEKSMKRKMAIYYTHNIKFISIYPGNLKHLEHTFPRKFEKVTGTKFH